MIWLGLLRRFWPILAAAVALIGLAIYLNQSGYKSGYAASEAKWQPLFAAAERARDEANARVAVQEARSTAQSAQSEKEHAESIASINLRAADADKRIRALSLRLAAPGSCRGEMRPVPGATTVPDAAPTSAERADRAGASISDTGRRCELDAATLAHLQNWITAQRAIDQP